MSLSMEEINAIKISLIECANEDGCKALGAGNTFCSRAAICKRTMKLIDTIEALQQEIEQHIKWNEEHTKARAKQHEELKLLTDKCLGLDTMLKDSERENRRLQAEAAKIPDICFYCRNEDGAFTYECIESERICPDICPKLAQK